MMPGRVADTDLAQLVFLEVRVDPQAAGRHHGHQGGADGRQHADAGAAIADIAVDRRAQDDGRAAATAEHRGRGLRPRQLGLAAFTVLAGVLFHADLADPNQFIALMKNIVMGCNHITKILQ